MNMRSYKCCTPTGQINQALEKSVSLLKILSDVSRIKILCILNKESYCVADLYSKACLSQSLTSHHLRDLKKYDLVKSKKIGQKVCYSLTLKGQKVYKLIFNLIRL